MTVLEVSEGGARILASQPLPSQALLDLRLRLPSHPVDVGVASRVIHANPVKGGHELAVRFVHMEAPDRIALIEFLEQVRQDGAIVDRP
jgi:hypothetical protein